MKPWTLIFGGSFNPPHQGHVEAVKDLLEQNAHRSQFAVGRIEVIPSYGTPLKNVDIQYEDRLEMTKLAFAPLGEKVRVNDIEGRHRLQYTFDLLERMQNEGELAFVIGTDQFEKFEQWSRFPQVMSLSHWIVLLRKPVQWTKIEPVLKKYLGQGWLKALGNDREYEIRVAGQSKRLIFVETQAREVASTEIRAHFARGNIGELKALIAPQVLDWIERKHLYGT